MGKLQSLGWLRDLGWATPYLGLQIIALPPSLSLGLLLALGATIFAPGPQASSLVGAAREVGCRLLLPAVAAFLRIHRHLGQSCDLSCQPC